MRIALLGRFKNPLTVHIVNHQFVGLARPRTRGVLAHEEHRARHDRPVRRLRQRVADHAVPHDRLQRFQLHTVEIVLLNVRNERELLERVGIFDGPTVGLRHIGRHQHVAQMLQLGLAARVGRAGNVPQGNIAVIRARHQPQHIGRRPPLGGGVPYEHLPLSRAVIKTAVRNLAAVHPRPGRIVPAVQVAYIGHENHLARGTLGGQRRDRSNRRRKERRHSSRAADFAKVVPAARISGRR